MCPACLRMAGGARAKRWKFLHPPSSAPGDSRPLMPSSPNAAAVRIQYLLDLLAQVPDPRKKRGRRHALASLLAVGIAAVIAGSKSFAAIGQWAADAGPEALAALGAARGPADESTFRRTFSLVSADVLDRVLGAWLHTRAVRAAGRLVIAIDGKTVRGAKGKDKKAPHPGRGPGPRHRRGPRPGRRGREVQRDPRGAGPAEGVRQPRLRSHHDRRDAHAARHRAGHPRPGRRLHDDRQGQYAGPLRAAQEAALGRRLFRLGREHGPRPPGPPHRQGSAGAVVDRVRRRPPRSRSCAARSRRGARRPSRSSTSLPATATRTRPPWPPGSATTGR